MPPPTLLGIVGGSGVPNRRRVPPIGNVVPFGGLHVAAAAVIAAVVDADDVIAAPVAALADAAAAVAAYVPYALALVVCAPLPLGGRSVPVSWRSSQAVSDGSVSSSMYSSWLVCGLPTSS